MFSVAKRPKIIAVDGPAGSGKSSICAEVCRRIGWTYVNTGALYRALAYIARQQGHDFSDENSLLPLIEDLARNMRWQPDSQQLWYKNENLTPHLHTVKTANDASSVAKMSLVREKLLPLQRQLSLMSNYGAIVDGRDIGTVVFPKADLKVFMTASLEERAGRRLKQMAESAVRKAKPKPDADLSAVMKDISLRDNQDAARGVAPMRQAEDAVLVDTSSMSVEAAVEWLVQLIKDKGLAE